MRNIISLIRKYSLAFALFILFILFSLLTEGRLLAPQNMSNLLLQNAYVLVLGCGMLMCILTGGNVDLSVGAIVCLVSAVAAELLNAGLDAVVVICISLILSLFLGCVQGFFIGYLHIPPFICTLAGMFIFRGIGRAIINSKTIIISNRAFFSIFTSYINVPVIDAGEVKWSAFILGAIVSLYVIVRRVRQRNYNIKKGYEYDTVGMEILKTAIIVGVILFYSWKIAHFRGVSVMLIWVFNILAIYEYMTSQTSAGRYFYAVGGNAKAAELSGINTKRIYFGAYVSMGFLAGLSGLLVAARIGSVNGDIGSSFEMDAIGACFIGGASAYGGSGTVIGVAIGAILLGIINQGMSIIGLDSNWQYIVKGGILLFAVAFEVITGRKNRS